MGFREAVRSVFGTAENSTVGRPSLRDAGNDSFARLAIPRAGRRE
jgi:hypothetical protein